jgi:hypothetical protein
MGDRPCLYRRAPFTALGQTKDFVRTKAAAAEPCACGCSVGGSKPRAPGPTPDGVSAHRTALAQPTGERVIWRTEMLREHGQ